MFVQSRATPIFRGIKIYNSLTWKYNNNIHSLIFINCTLNVFLKQSSILKIILFRLNCSLRDTVARVSCVPHGPVVLFTKILTIDFDLKRKRTILFLFTKIPTRILTCKICRNSTTVQTLS